MNAVEFKTEQKTKCNAENQEKCTVRPGKNSFTEREGGHNLRRMLSSKAVFPHTTLTNLPRGFLQDPLISHLVPEYVQQGRLMCSFCPSLKQHHVCSGQFIDFFFFFKFWLFVLARNTRFSVVAAVTVVCNVSTSLLTHLETSQS